MALPFGGEILAETDLSGAILNEYIFFAGKRIAMLPAGGNPLYYAEDLLGSSRLTSRGRVARNGKITVCGLEHRRENFTAGILGEV